MLEWREQGYEWSPVVASVDFSGAFASGNLSDYGADGAGTGSVVTYELILDSAYTEGTPSGLTSGECRSVCMSQAE
ncbi:hypothetical protein MY494_02950 [Synechococcus sp. A10-1-5-1]|uniref:hypothetical protein n=1 Tax=Synechococcus sp. A10-1-5-1 TaxID=2936507 RepID=UPI0020012F7A|nr:hypothetical protein [Synechococcus sp. A10-1-5-1]UPM50758.1 hypothetical protein MY494_02950 [Synechococcus sp. A10-1-5-1]